MSKMIEKFQQVNKRRQEDGLPITPLAMFAEAYELFNNQWISVDERLPEHGELVLSLSTKKLKSHNVYNISDLDDFESEETTHWMPLPQPPKEN